VPLEVGEDWWVEHVVHDALRAIDDPDTIAVLMTGRKELLFRTRIEGLLRQAGLQGFDWVFLNDDKKHTSATKCNQMRKILTANRHVNEVHIFEDRYMETYTDFLSRLSDNNALGRRVTVVPHDIKEKPNPPQCAPKDFKYALGRADLMDVTSSADEIESIVARADR